eukprot:TRINITY_DN17747_c0_g1_i1.p1 TRINITY_DN17747_c0_g1~~TRINITY_DN17747_c0_g1_i1.p1  ORF type:complete len:503 (-),score=118.75 TRINITY_DN17747_c0_g1_i1:47-1555(-)
MGSGGSCECAGINKDSESEKQELDTFPTPLQADSDCVPVPSATAPPATSSAEEDEAPKAAAAPLHALAVGSMVLGRYSLVQPVGEGGWCSVWRAEEKTPGPCPGRFVAVKTYRDQLLREVADDALADRFRREVATFRRLGADRHQETAGGDTACAQVDPRKLLVNLLDLSGAWSEPARSTDDGRYYAVLELAEESLEGWLRNRPAGIPAALAGAQEVGAALCNSLAWLHAHSLCHLDVKPANILRFGGLWKLIDLEGALELPGGTASSPEAAQILSTDGFTPLYAAPEMARAVLQQPKTSLLSDLLPAATMDVWSAGVVVLDVLAGVSVFEETFAGYQAQALMSFDAEDADERQGLLDWYGWLSEETPLKLSDHLPRNIVDALGTVVLAEGAASSKDDAEARSLRSFLELEVLAKNAAQRPTAASCAEFFGRLKLPGAESTARSPEVAPAAVHDDESQAVVAEPETAGPQQAETVDEASRPGPVPEPRPGSKAKGGKCCVVQ